MFIISLPHFCLSSPQKQAQAQRWTHQWLQLRGAGVIKAGHSGPWGRKPCFTCLSLCSHCTVQSLAEALTVTGRMGGWVGRRLRKFQPWANAIGTMSQGEEVIRQNSPCRCRNLIDPSSEMQTMSFQQLDWEKDCEGSAKSVLRWYLPASREEELKSNEWGMWSTFSFFTLSRAA